MQRFALSINSKDYKCFTQLLRCSREFSITLETSGMDRKLHYLRGTRHNTKNVMSKNFKQLKPPPLRDDSTCILLRGFKTTHTDKQTARGEISLWKRLVVVGAFGVIFGYSYYTIYRRKEIKKEEVRYEEFKKAEIGGDWTLIDQNGKERSSKDFRGQWILLYFGFTHCPDICPEELEKLVDIVKHFEKDPKLPNMKPIFITLDPDRDTPTAIKEYLADFKCPSLEGFTAPTVEAIKEVATKYRAYFSKGVPDEDNDYIVDHTIIIYVVSPEGQFVNFFDRGKSAKQIITTVSDHIHKYDKLRATSL